MLKKRSTIYKKYIFPAIGGMIGTSLYVLGDTILVGRRLGAIGLLIPEYLAMAFVANEPEIIKNAAYGIRLYFLAFPLVGVNLVITIYLQSQKQTTKAFIFSLLRGLILIIILLLILTPTLKIPGVWLVMPITEIIALGVGLILVRNRKLKTR